MTPLRLLLPLQETKGKKLTIDVANGLSYHGDEGAIRQLVSILTENAVKYADEGGEIAVKLFTSHNGKETDLEVSNTCKEPPQGDLTKLFDRFYRDDSSRSRSKGREKGRLRHWAFYCTGNSQVAQKQDIMQSRKRHDDIYSTA